MWERHQEQCCLLCCQHPVVLNKHLCPGQGDGEGAMEQGEEQVLRGTGTRAGGGVVGRQSPRGAAAPPPAAPLSSFTCQQAGRTRCKRGRRRRFARACTDSFAAWTAQNF